MKKFLFAFILVGTLATFSSCKKTYTCECITSYSGTGAPATTSTSTFTYTDTKTKAGDSCDKLDATSTTVGITTTTACSIK